MQTKPLSELYYQDREVWEAEYRRRYDSPYSVRLDFDIRGNPAFFLQTPEIFQRLTAILRLNQEVYFLSESLPGEAMRQFARRSLVDELILTNSIEGVHSTRKELYEVLDQAESQNMGKRFYGLVRKYEMLMKESSVPMDTCQDIREIYDELVLPEVRAENPDHAPDGVWFRKGPVSIYSPTQKEIHRGSFPEAEIIGQMEQALRFLHDPSCDSLYRIGIFHYLLEYIHPFYDGNGRLGRFLCSCLLSRELIPVTAYRISYTIKEQIRDYYRAFSVCNDPHNRGELTAFLEMFLGILHTSLTNLRDALGKGREDLVRLWKTIPDLTRDADDPKLRELYSLLIQAALFSEQGVTAEEAASHLGVSRGTLYRKLEQIPPELLEKVRRNRVYYYSLNIRKLEENVEK